VGELLQVFSTIIFLPNCAIAGYKYVTNSF